jgi:hypothetical protein
MAEVSGRNLTINNGPQHPAAVLVLLLSAMTRAWSAYLPTALARLHAKPQEWQPPRSQKGAYEGIFKKPPKTYLFDFGAPGRNPGGNCR